LELREVFNVSKFMQSLGDSAYIKLRKIADDRDITVQELIRAIVIPDWLKTAEKHNGGESQSERHRRRVIRSPRVAVVAAVPGSKPKRKQ
jgi:hypothetical protein